IIDKKATVNIGVSLTATTTVSLSNSNQYSISSKDQNIIIRGGFDEISAYPTSLPLLSLLVKTAWSKNLPPIDLETFALSPAGAGLGGSSCLAVSALNCLFYARNSIDPGFKIPSEAETVRLAQDVESKIIHAPTGIQDYWGGLRGQLNILTYEFGRVNIETLSCDSLATSGFEIICCYSGKSRASAINNWEIFKRVFDNDKETIEHLSLLGSASLNCANAILRQDWSDAFANSNEEWKIRCNLWPGVETSETIRIDRAAKEAGALFTRVCGAGGGGVMIAISKRNSSKSVKDAMTASGGIVLDATIGCRGTSTKCLSQ
ncbi:MAG: hypothetical protein NT027_02345, partial [Proteobacteria bacterium]|nr:hypothetical protein [Pseudomonadota bacterium]